MSIDAYRSAIAADDDQQTEAAAHRLRPEDEPHLIQMIEADDPDQRWWAVRGLALVGAQASVAPVAACLHDDDAGVRAAAALALAYLHAREPAGVTRYLDVVAGMLADDDGSVRQTAADCLSRCGDDAVPALANVLATDAHEGARTRAASALRKIATFKAAAVLYPRLNDTNHLVRMYAFEALDEMGLLENVLLMP